MLLSNESTLGVILQVVRRQSLRRKSTLSSLLFGEDEVEALKAKNIKQTELVAVLREAIGHTAEHFHCLDPRNSSTVRLQQSLTLMMSACSSNSR